MAEDISEPELLAAFRALSFLCHPRSHLTYSANEHAAKERLGVTGEWVFDLHSTQALAWLTLSLRHLLGTLRNLDAST